MSCISDHAQNLRQRGYRMTPQRLAILEALHHRGHLSPREIFSQVRHTGMTEATVYRTLEFLTARGILCSSYNNSNHLTYELSGRDHHHLVCRECGTQAEVEHQAVAGFFQELEQRTGFHLDPGHLTVFGLCSACQGQPVQGL